MIPVFCAGCGEPLDRGSTECRVCGEDNSLEALEYESAYEFATDLPLDKLQPWSQIKHRILEKYLSAYTTILSRQSWVKRYVYIDAFAGAGVALDRDADDLVAAGALRALDARPPFTEYHFIELNREKAEILERLVADRGNAHVHRGDFRQILPPLLNRCLYGDFVRGVCLLDPYGLTVDYALLSTIAAMRSVEIFFNFMLMSANRNVLWRDPKYVTPRRRDLLTRVWGAEWINELYTRQTNLFGGEVFTKQTNEHVIEAYRRRLQDAGFAYVPQPIPMRNRLNAPLYYLFFCGHNGTGARIVREIFDGFR